MREGAGLCGVEPVDQIRAPAEAAETRAAASLGAGIWRGFFQVMLPLIAPGVIVGAIIAFIILFDEVVVANFLSVGAERALPRMIFSGVRESISPAIASAAVLLVLFSAVLLTLMGAVQARAAAAQKGAERA